MLFIVLLFIISIVTISFITSQTIVKPIKKISVGAEEIAKGNLDYNIDYESTNELGQMADSFNNMRVRLSASLENQRKAEEERRELVAGIAHDLRTPLTSVKGYAEGLRDGIASTPEKQRLYINTICSSIDDTEKTLDDLLAYSKLELKSFSLNPERVYINEFFKDGAEEIKTALEAVDFDFNYISTCSDDTVLMLDSDRFTRVIRNIISNSIKYKREGVKGKVELHINEYERSVIIEITDNGIGVDKESLPKIFDTMYRADRARSGVSEGSGLGLSICRQIVELHGGTIWATGNYGQGLSIFISMPKEISK
ncbi:MAG: HAMP domain-containing histidine kinase [Eubacterium sp.]|nr:HAMP domain-containing histidine kinase [Eubacterium sp.]